MLQELYEYAVSNHLAARPGFKLKKPKAYVCLGKDGRFLGIDPEPQEPVLCPDMGSAAQGPAKCNIIVEKRNISLSEERPQKKAFFLKALEDAAKYEPKMAVLRQALDQKETVSQMNAALDQNKVKPGDIISFKVDGIALERLIDDWWPQYRKIQIGSCKGTVRRPCLITGQMDTPVTTADKISGLRVVGGHSSGDAIVCFDKDAFCSYGLKQAENACIGEEAMVAVNASLNQLIQKAPTLAGAKWVHWYKESLPSDVDDKLEELFGPSLVSEEEVEEDIPFLAAQADAQADRLIQSHQTGEKMSHLKNTYYLMPLSGAGGRIMVRGWKQGSYEELQQAIDDWWNDLSLVLPNGRGMLKLPAIGKINFRLLKPQKNGKSVNERMKNELAGLEPQLILAIVNDHPLPDVIAFKALQYIQSHLREGMGKETQREPIPDPVACQILKAWVIRKNKINTGGIMMKPACNHDYPEVAYHCGRMMAVYAAIQSRAMGKNLGAGVLQRYYTSACASPALVFGKLSQLAQHHLAKIENKGAVAYYEKLLGEISQKIGEQYPTKLNLIQQSEFSLGYYQQHAEMLSRQSSSEANEEKQN